MKYKVKPSEWFSLIIIVLNIGLIVYFIAADAEMQSIYRTTAENSSREYGTSLSEYKKMEEQSKEEVEEEVDDSVPISLADGHWVGVKTVTYGKEISTALRSTVRVYEGQVYVTPTRSVSTYQNDTAIDIVDGFIIIDGKTFPIDSIEKKTLYEIEPLRDWSNRTVVMQTPDSEDDEPKDALYYDINVQELPFGHSFHSAWLDEHLNGDDIWYKHMFLRDTDTGPLLCYMDVYLLETEENLYWHDEFVGIVKYYWTKE